jgi:hypothetical protein
MNKERPSQLELFSQADPCEHLIAKPVDSGLLDFIKLYEKALLLVIGFVITGIVAFCLGVENGKTAAITSGSSRFDVAGPKSVQDPGGISFSKKEIPKSEKPQNPDSRVSFSIQGQLKNMPVKQEIILQDPASGQDKSAYTVQIASYQARGSAEKEMAKLRLKGLTPLVIKKGSYSVVCVGTFNNKEKAKSLLTQLKSKYRDCYIRRL